MNDLIYQCRADRAAIDGSFAGDTPTRRRAIMFAFLRRFHREIPLAKALKMARETHPESSE